MASSSHCFAHAIDVQRKSPAQKLRRIPRATFKGNDNSNGLEHDRLRLESLLKSDGRFQVVTSSKCTYCGSKGDVECVTCGGSGLYIDSILESQGIIVQVNCLGCGGCGKIMCPHCGGRGCA